MSLEDHQKNMNEDKPILSAAKMTPIVNLVSSKIKVMRIVAGIRWTGVVKM